MFPNLSFYDSGEVDFSKAELSLSLNISLVGNFSNEGDDVATRLKWGSPQEGD